MGTSPEHDGTPTGGDEAPAPVPVSSVRTEHHLRVELRQTLARNTTFERALRESAAFAHGRRDQTDLRKLRAALSAAGFRDPNVKPAQDDDDI